MAYALLSADRSDDTIHGSDRPEIDTRSRRREGIRVLSKRENVWFVFARSRATASSVG